MVPVTALMPLADAPRKWQISTNSDEIELQSLDDGSSTDMEDEVDSSDSPMDVENVSNRPGTSTRIRWQLSLSPQAVLSLPRINVNISGLF